MRGCARPAGGALRQHLRAAARRTRPGAQVGACGPPADPEHLRDACLAGTIASEPLGGLYPSRKRQFRAPPRRKKSRRLETLAEATEADSHRLAARPARKLTLPAHRPGRHKALPSGGRGIPVVGARRAAFLARPLTQRSDHRLAAPPIREAVTDTRRTRLELNHPHQHGSAQPDGGTTTRCSCPPRLLPRGGVDTGATVRTGSNAGVSGALLLPRWLRSRWLSSRSPSRPRSTALGRGGCAVAAALDAPQLPPALLGVRLRGHRASEFSQELLHPWGGNLERHRKVVLGLRTIGEEPLKLLDPVGGRLDRAPRPATPARAGLASGTPSRRGLGRASLAACPARGRPR